MEPCFFYRATDKIYGITSDSYLIVEIIDENDNVPIFSQNTYYAAINQDDPIGECSTRKWPEVIKLLSCSTHLNMKFQLFI